MTVGFVVVTFNSEAVLADCLASIPRGRPIVVVDNASRDRSVEIARSFGAQVVSNSRNMGFGAACNRGAKCLSTSHVFFLNPDVILTGRALGELEKAIERFPEAGSFGPAVKIYGQTRSFRDKSYIQDQCSRYIEDSDAPSDYTEVGYIDGAALVCDRQAFLGLGGFDENLFLYYEDDDLCYRMRSQNKTLIYVPQSMVQHRKKASSGDEFKLHYVRAWHETSSRMKLSKKYTLCLNANKEKKRAAIRFVRSVVTFRFNKAARYWGTLMALNGRMEPRI
jgi:N-acetylglucosaminyl-diphospho-decaprenol L-rhamnosyltransferase